MLVASLSAEGLPALERRARLTLDREGLAAPAGAAGLLASWPCAWIWTTATGPWTPVVSCWPCLAGAAGASRKPCSMRCWRCCALATACAIWAVIWAWSREALGGAAPDGGLRRSERRRSGPRRSIRQISPPNERYSPLPKPARCQ
ncbi:hypothetical protein HML84_07975 [Alcanivorax sp. IO_7]|nr:hypothetical protein HML84_07975 [Alcanivorax sp. IO_7]